jgi:twitching motility two-component system response regulator PilH
MRKKILLVDDTVTITALEKLLLGRDFDYLEARNGEEAFARARAESPDLILMDLNMPVKNGIEGLRSLKADPATAHIPVVIVTTRSELDAVALCRALGCAAFLTKPIERDLINATVNLLLAS